MLFASADRTPEGQEGAAKRLSPLKSCRAAEYEPDPAFCTGAADVTDSGEGTNARMLAAGVMPNENDCEPGLASAGDGTGSVVRGAGMVGWLTTEDASGTCSDGSELDRRLSDRLLSSTESPARGVAMQREDRPSDTLMLADGPPSDLLALDGSPPKGTGMLGDCPPSDALMPGDGPPCSDMLALNDGALRGVPVMGDGPPSRVVALGDGHMTRAGDAGTAASFCVRVNSQ
eukprot:jgi/Mesvir1/15301/Mv06509-RA.1